jgi:hypothetical protein
MKLSPTTSRNLIAASISTAVLGCLAHQALAATDKKKPKNADQKIENVLDTLEKRLLDKEASPLTLDEEATASAPSHNARGSSQKYSPKGPAGIVGQTPKGKNIQELQRKINEYDNRVEILEADLRKLRSGVYEASATDNQILLEVKAGNATKFIIRTLTARLDGNTLYNQLDPAGLWMPTRSIPVFFGPLQPGEHRLDVTAMLAPLNQNGLEMPTWNQKGLQQSFSFAVPDGKMRKTISIEINDAKGDGSQPMAKMTEVETK